ncbi:MAG TPA: twin-arginine translocase TatA/TatE family subunit [Polyangia bacterium]|jgi:sec-independent protein translocase protein TatA|nr:twin-arginine translocase TatA/TatE family subunit [Polyangia bacterium]
MFGLGASELVLILLIVVVVFGASKLPQLGDGLGRAIKNFKRAVTSANEIEVSAKKPEIPGEQPKPGSAQSSEPAPKP